MDPARAVRVDLGSVDSDTATELFTAYDSVVQRQSYALRELYLEGLDREDLVAVGQIAILEAYLTWNRYRQKSFKSWVVQVVRWRMRETVQDCAVAPHDRQSLPKDYQMTDHAETNTPESRYLAQEEDAWFEVAVGQLTRRQGVIIAARLKGETLAQIAASLGVDVSLVFRDLQTAVEALQKRVQREAVDCQITPR